MATANLSVESKDFTLPVVEAMRIENHVHRRQELDPALPRIPDRAVV